VTTSFIYPTIVDEIRSSCLSHVLSKISADDLQRTIQQGEEVMVALEEKDIRCFLTDVEGELELIKFTIDVERQLEKTQIIAQKVLMWFSKRNSDISNIGIVVRRESLINLGYLNIVSIAQLLEYNPLDINDDLIAFGPFCTMNTADSLCQRLQDIGLKHIDDFFKLADDFPEWCRFKTGLQKKPIESQGDI
jgi:hypothetical protein